MTILVFSDSHSSLSFMRRCVDSVKPDALIHLGDYYEDGHRRKKLPSYVWHFLLE